MQESNSQIFGEISTHNKFISKSLVNYNFKNIVKYIGRQNKALIFQKGYDGINIITFYIQQSFALNGQMKIFKKWFIEDVETIYFIPQSNQCIISTKNNIFIAKIENYYNINNSQVIFNKDQPTYGLVVSENNKLIIAYFQTYIISLIKEGKLQNKKCLGFGKKNFVSGCKLNDEGNIVIVSFFQIPSAHYLYVSVKSDGHWQQIKELRFEPTPLQYVFLDNQKFLTFSNGSGSGQAKLQVFQIFQETLEIKLMNEQDFQITENLQYKLRFFKQRGLLAALGRRIIYIKQQIKTEFKISSQEFCSRYLAIHDIINKEWVFSESLAFDGNKYKISVSKFYGK